MRGAGAQGSRSLESNATPPHARPNGRIERISAVAGYFTSYEG